jgi:IS4 transposase
MGNIEDCPLLHWILQLSFLPVEAGAFYVMDRGYLDFARLFKWHQAGAFFVTRAKRNMNARRVYSIATDRNTGVICDQRIALNGFYAATDYPERLRRIRFKDPESGKHLIFLTNNTTLPPLTIAALYRNRWQAGLFFKWIKQHLRIKRFLGTRENAVKTQIGCAISTYVLIAIVKKELQLDPSLYTFLQFLSVSVFEKMPIQQAFAGNDYIPEQLDTSNQLNLFDF